MKLQQGNMWDGKADVILFTANATVRRDGILVMGRGAASQALSRFRDSGAILGKLIIEHRHATNYKPYGVLYYQRETERATTFFRKPKILGAFQVKRNFYDDAEVELIVASLDILGALAVGPWINYAISMNFPGIGFGNLNRSEVLSHLEVLPDNVTIWEYDNA